MKKLRSVGFFNLFLAAGIFFGFQIASFAFPEKSAVKSYTDVGEIAPNDLKDSLVLSPTLSSTLIEQETPHPQQLFEQSTTLNSNHQSNYLVILVEKAAFSPPDEQSEIAISQIKSIWLVISQAGSPRLTWQPINTASMQQSNQSITTYNDLFDFLENDQKISYDQYFIVNRSGIQLAVHLLSQVIHHVGNPQDAESLYRLSNIFSHHKLDVLQEAQNIAQLCSLIPDPLSQVDVNRFLNIMHASYYTDISKTRIQAALYDFQEPGVHHLICDFPILNTGISQTNP